MMLRKNRLQLNWNVSEFRRSFYAGNILSLDRSGHLADKFNIDFSMVRMLQAL